MSLPVTPSALRSTSVASGITENRDPRSHFYIKNQKHQLQDRMKTLRGEASYRQASHDTQYLCPANNGSLAYGTHLEGQYLALRRKSMNETIAPSEADWLQHLEKKSAGISLHKAHEVAMKQDAKMLAEFEKLFDAKFENLMRRERLPETNRLDLAIAYEMAGMALEIKRTSVEKKRKEESERKGSSMNEGEYVASSSKEGTESCFVDTESQSSSQEESPETDAQPSLEELQRNFDLAKSNWNNVRKVFIKHRKILVREYQRKYERIPRGYPKQEPHQGHLVLPFVKSTLVIMCLTHGLTQDLENRSLFIGPRKDTPGRHSVEFVGMFKLDPVLYEYISQIFYSIKIAIGQGTLSTRTLKFQEDYFAYSKDWPALVKWTRNGSRALLRSGSFEKFKGKLLAQEAYVKTRKAAHAILIQILAALNPGLALFQESLGIAMDNGTIKKDVMGRVLEGQSLKWKDFLRGILARQCIGHSTGKEKDRLEKKRKIDEEGKTDGIWVDERKAKLMATSDGLRKKVKVKIKQ
ncbi:hypothetical protein HYFRA_00004868 [Hymenoscyphus fraxineus]|uniref:Uncharacterized protein n=1 Tax=Hymenoscyphus fraxineus TaxID=746836 RepID=A0A9N9KM69_9HELO|nr:hypothetical protein HYFRA_00004868 [Hymenoscyphus fraxineus]